MGNENRATSGRKDQLRDFFGKFVFFVGRWFFLLVLFATSLYAVAFWKKYILNADWSEEKKNEYIKERSVLSFDEEKFKKALGVRNSRREWIENGEKFTGRDIFFPEGF